MGKASSNAFLANTGVPQGDSLSPCLFTLYLAAALSEIHVEECSDPDTLPKDIQYADDADFISKSREHLENILTQTERRLSDYSLTVNAAKTEWTSYQRRLDADAEHWRATRKLGTLLGEDNEIRRRKGIAMSAFTSLQRMWRRRHLVSEATRIKMYNSFIIPQLIFNCGTWALTKVQEEAIDSFHRRQLRILIGCFWPNKISNAELYRRTGSRPLSWTITWQRWTLFGHVLRMDSRTPAVQSIVHYFSETTGGLFRGRPRTTLATRIRQDIRGCGLGDFNTMSDASYLAALAADRDEWVSVCISVLNSYIGRGAYASLTGQTDN